MKHFFTLVVFVFSITVVAQSKEHAGQYYKESKGEDYLETNKLTLNPNGTFLFHHYRYLEKGTPKEEVKYGKGTWTSNKRLIFLKTVESDIDATHVLNLNNSKLRFDTKSPRDTSNRDIKTSVRFYASDIFWLKGRTLLKIR